METEFTTEAVYEVVALENVGEIGFDPESTRLDKVASLLMYEKAFALMAGPVEPSIHTATAPAVALAGV